jgi:hypothetical protein
VQHQRHVVGLRGFERARGLQYALGGELNASLFVQATFYQDCLCAGGLTCQFCTSFVHHQRACARIPEVKLEFLQLVGGIQGGGRGRRCSRKEGDYSFDSVRKNDRDTISPANTGTLQKLREALYLRAKRAVSDHRTSGRKQRGPPSFSGDCIEQRVIPVHECSKFLILEDFRYKSMVDRNMESSRDFQAEHADDGRIVTRIASGINQLLVL